MRMHSDAVLIVSQCGITAGSSMYLRMSAIVGSRTAGSLEDRRRPDDLDVIAARRIVDAQHDPRIATEVVRLGRARRGADPELLTGPQVPVGRHLRQAVAADRRHDHVRHGGQDPCLALG